MKTSHILLLTSALMLTAFAQLKPRMIIPGKGLSEVSVGQTRSLSEVFLGSATKALSREQEVASWTKSGYNTQKEMIFNLSWDSVFTYSSGDKSLGIFKIFTENGRIAAINFSRYWLSIEMLESLRTTGNINFKSNVDQIKKIFGNKPLVQMEEGKSKDYYYLSKGIGFLIDEDDNTVGNIIVYRPIKGKKAKKLASEIQGSGK